MKGRLIVIEGIDEVGKTTFAHKMVEALNKSYPDSAVYLESLNDVDCLDRFIRNHVAHGKWKGKPQVVALMMSAARWSKYYTIQTLLDQYQYVVMDRWTQSKYAYMTPLEGHGIRESMLQEIDRGLPNSDVVFYLDAEYGSVDSAYMKEVLATYKFNVNDSIPNYIVIKNRDDIEYAVNRINV